VSHTTRRAREGEQDGVDYHFVTAAHFRQLREQGAFLEHAEYSGRLYGTSEEALEELLEAGYDAVIEIEVQGARQIRRRRPDARFIFLLPPSMEALEERLRGRGTDDEEAIEQRLAVADLELEAAEIFDYAVVNDDLSQAVVAVLEIIAAERVGCVADVKRRFGREVVIAGWPC
jgi:guanylate kinase